jgi:tetratricopeptide (TPR) repeat protein
MAAKEAGNKAFGAKKYEEAVEHFTKAIEMDPRWEAQRLSRRRQDPGAVPPFLPCPVCAPPPAAPSPPCMPSRASHHPPGHGRLFAPPRSSEVFLSNRSAAYAALGRFQLALDDAAAVARLKPRWAKGHARRGAALMGLKRFGEARQAYETALRIEPDDQALVRGRDRVRRRPGAS